MSASTQKHAGSSWFTFAGVMFVIAGVSNLLWGIGALDDKQYLPEKSVLFSSLHFWGWLSLIWAAMALGTAVLLLMRNPWSAGLGLVMATVSAVFWLFALPLLPIWSLLVIAIDVLIIYGLSTNLDVLE